MDANTVNTVILCVLTTSYIFWQSPPVHWNWDIRFI